MDRHTFPNKGWEFFQPQTGWRNPMAMVSFSESVKAIINHRKANPAITAKHKLSTDFQQVGDELEAYTRKRLGLPNEGAAPIPFLGSPSNLSLGGVAAGIKRAAQGTAVPLDWLQSGGDPVDQALAEKRASVCVACPRNVPGAWYTVAPAQLIRVAIESWQKLKGRDFKFETLQGENLKSCDVCKCLMRLKVFTPLSHIVNNTRPEIMAELPPNCWIKKNDQ